MSNFNGLKRPAFLSVVAALGVVVTAGQAKAGSIANTDLGTISGLTLVESATNPFVQTFPLGNAGQDVGTLTSSVYQETSGDYIYEDTFTPAVSAYTPPVADPFGGVDSFKADFMVAGFTGVAGYNYSGVAGLGGTVAAANAFFIAADVNTHISWNYLDPNQTWNGGQSLSFFFESTDAPAPTLVDSYEALGDIEAYGMGYVPEATVIVPVPAAASMGLVAMAGLAGFGLLRRYRAAR